jgi:hypothetical protein
LSKRGDQIFQLSLTEIAFTIAFMLLLLLGYLVFKEQTERIAAQEALAKVQTAEQATQTLADAKSAFAKEMQLAGAQNPDDVITKLIAADKVRQERDLLKKRVEDLDAKLTAMTALQESIDKASKSRRDDISREEIEAALALQDQVRKFTEKQDDKPATDSKKQGESIQLTLDKVKQALTISEHFSKSVKQHLARDIKPGDEAKTVDEIVSAAKNVETVAGGAPTYEKVSKDNSDLRGQVAFLKNRLDARGGRDFPPCWADETGKVEFLFAVDIKPDSIVVTPAWPTRRDAAAHALPGIDAVLAAPHSHANFPTSIQGIFNWSKAQDPECRHYVQLKSSIPDAVLSDRVRLMVENYFYKIEARR